MLFQSRIFSIGNLETSLISSLLLAQFGLQSRSKWRTGCIEKKYRWNLTYSKIYVKRYYCIPSVHQILEWILVFLQVTTFDLIFVITAFSLLTSLWSTNILSSEISTLASFGTRYSKLSRALRISDSHLRGVFTLTQTSLKTRLFCS